MSVMSPFSDSLNDPDAFTLTYELVPGHGAGGKKIDRLLAFAERARQDGRIKALSITDNAGGHPALAPVAIGSEIRKIGLEPMIHFSLKDKNRNQVESHLFLYQRQQFRYLLVLGGDFPRQTYYGQAKPVYDLDTIQTIELVEHIKAGHYKQMDDDVLKAMPFAFQCGCVVSPFKSSEAEQVWQYAKLLKKIQAGAKFIVTQLGFDLEKYGELIRFLQRENISLPVLANIFIPSPGVARIMAKGGVPGVLFPESLARRMGAESKDQRLQRAARMMAILRGLGYNGVHLGGNGLNYNDVCQVLDQAEEYKANWQEHWEKTQVANSGSWSFFKPGSHTPLELHPGKKPGTRPIHQLTHTLLFNKTTPVGRTFSAFCKLCDRFPTSRSLFTTGEMITKQVLFSCRMCGDCTLAESTYLCPQSGCPKKLVNGPCGGSRNMQCEVFPDRFCFYVRMYQRLAQQTTLHDLSTSPALPPKNWALENSSSWINFFQGRDHTG